MARKHYTDVIGTLGSGGLTNSATTHTFTSLTYANGTAVPTLTGTDSFLLSILDASGNVLEVIKVTAYNSGTKAATIARAQEGTTAIAHAGSLNVASSAYPSDFDTPPFHGVKVYRSATLTLTGGSSTLIGWDAEEYDTDGYHDNATNNSRLTVPTGLDGYYRVSALVYTDSSANTARWLTSIGKNGGTLRGGAQEFSASLYPGGNVSVDVYLAAGDYVDCSQFTDTAARNLYLSQCAFSMHRIGV